MFANRIAARARDTARDAEARQAVVHEALGAHLPPELVAVILARAARPWAYAPPLHAQTCTPLERNLISSNGLPPSGERLLVSHGPPSGFAYRLLLAPDTLMSEGRVPRGAYAPTEPGFVRYDGLSAVSASGSEWKRLTVHLVCTPDGRSLGMCVLRVGPDGRMHVLADLWLTEGFQGVRRVRTTEGLVLELHWEPPPAVDGDDAGGD